MERVIFHCDLNSFYASVELLDHPELRHLPVAVCGDPNSRHGIILAKNEPAKLFGVKTAETIWQARKKCPELVLLPAHHDRYRELSRQINRVYQDYTDLVESFGIDESWLDVTGTLHLFGGDPEALADQLREHVRGNFGLTISVGVSFNKVFAKLGSDYKKPDATTLITRENLNRLYGLCRSPTCSMSGGPPPGLLIALISTPSATWLALIGSNFFFCWVKMAPSSMTLPVGRTAPPSHPPPSTSRRSQWAMVSPFLTICGGRKIYRLGSPAFRTKWLPAFVGIT